MENARDKFIYEILNAAQQKLHPLMAQFKRDISRKGTTIRTTIDNVTRALVVLLVVLVVSPAVAAQGETDWARLNVAAREHAKTPIRAGVPGVRPFWNAHAKAFIHPPAFEFQEVKGTTEYRFTLMAHNDVKDPKDLKDLKDPKVLKVTKKQQQ